MRARLWGWPRIRKNSKPARRSSITFASPASRPRATAAAPGTTRGTIRTSGGYSLHTTARTSRPSRPSEPDSPPTGRTLPSKSSGAWISSFATAASRSTAPMWKASSTITSRDRKISRQRPRRSPDSRTRTPSHSSRPGLPAEARRRSDLTARRTRSPGRSPETTLRTFAGCSRSGRHSGRHPRRSTSPCSTVCAMTTESAGCSSSTEPTARAAGPAGSSSSRTYRRTTSKILTWHARRSPGRTSRRWSSSTENRPRSSPSWSARPSSRQRTAASWCRTSQPSRPA